MSNWKALKEEQERDFLYIYEANSNDVEEQRLTGIKTSQTVGDLKRSIATKLNNPQGWRAISVAFVDKELSDANATLSSFGVEEGDLIVFTRSVTPAVNPPAYSSEKVFNNIMFRDVEGKTHNLHGVPSSWKVKQLLQKFGTEKAITVEFFRYIWSGKQLEHERTLESYGLQDDCTIHMTMTMKGGYFTPLL